MLSQELSQASQSETDFKEIIVRDQLESDDDKLIHFPYGSTG